MELTVFAKCGGPLTKRISLNPDGSLVSDGSACVMSAGTAQRFEFGDIGLLAELIEQLTARHAIALGALRNDVLTPADVVTKHKVNGAGRPDIIARTNEYLVYHKDKPAITLIDFDAKGIPIEVRDEIDEVGDPWPALTMVMPALGGTAHLIRSSTSAGLYRTDTGEKLSGSGGQHLYVVVKDGTDI
jgi:hypothetical protein